MWSALEDREKSKYQQDYAKAKKRYDALPENQKAPPRTRRKTGRKKMSKKKLAELDRYLEQDPDAISPAALDRDRKHQIETMVKCLKRVTKFVSTAVSKSKADELRAENNELKSALSDAM